MNDQQNKSDKIVDVPYFTRNLTDSNTFRISRRIINSKNVANYRRKINEIVVNDKVFQTEKLNNVINASVRIIK